MKNNNKKSELLEIAYEMFTKNGYDNTSIDDIIEKAQIAKGTYYYYFESKEQTLEEVTNMMIEKELKVAQEILDSDSSVENKLFGIILAMRPNVNEEKVQKEVKKNENVVMQQKIKSKIIDKIIPLLSKVIEQGIEEKIFNCTDIENRVKMILIISTELFDDKQATNETIETFIDVTEKILGAKSGTLTFIKNLTVKN